MNGTSPRRRGATRTGMAAVLMATLLAGCAEASSAPSASSTPAPSRSGSAIERPAAPEGTLPDELKIRLQETLERTVSEYGVPGAAVGVWIPNEGSWTSAVGVADIEHDVPADDDMQWPLRSITKSYTVTLVLQLVDDGVVGLDDTIDQYVQGVTDGGEITLRELAGMTSGNADYTNEDFLDAFLEDPERIFTLDDLNGFILGKPAQFAPGAEKVYTNSNTNLLGAVVEEATGQPFEEVLRERILQPLGQNDTHYIVDVEEWHARHAVGYAPEEEGAEPQPTNLSIYGPAGSMVSSLDDGRVWAEILATGGLLEPETQEERLIGAPLDAGPPYDSYALGIGKTAGWWGHNGEGFGFTAALFHQPDSGASIVVFMNMSNFESGAHPADQLFRQLADEVETEVETEVE